MPEVDAVRLRSCRGRDEWPVLVQVWRSAVEATHDFLTADDVAGYRDRLATEFLPAVQVTVAEIDGRVVGFAGQAGRRLEMLFVDAACRGLGVGSALLAAAMSTTPDLLVDVNEQNPQAVGFYLRHGLRVVGRSATDGEGRPFPLLHLAATAS